MNKRYASLAMAAVLVSPLSALAQATQKQTSKMIMVHEGTDMSVTVSPDRSTVLMDLQGLIFSMPMKGGAAHQLTQPVDEMSQPSYSPKGDLVAMQGYKGGTFHIWVMKPDGTGLRQLTTGHGDDREPVFSPDGTTIAFSSDRSFEGSYDVWTVNLATGALKRITSSEADEYEPSFSPDGSKLAYISSESVLGEGGRFVPKSSKVMSLTLATGATEELLDGGKAKLDAPTWGPGNHLAVVSVVAGRMYGGKSTLLVDGKPVASSYDDVFPFHATWLSPTELVFTANGKIVHADLAADTKTETPFTAEIASHRPIYTPKNFHFDDTTPHAVKGIFAPALSPDGKQVAFVALNQLYLLTIGQPTPKALTNDLFYKQGPMWSPDGKQLAYVSDKGGVENVYLLDVATGTEKPLALNKAQAQIFPAWSPDAKSMAWQDQTGATYLTDVASAKTEVLAPSTFFPGRASFSPDGKTVLIATVKPYTKRFREGTSSILAVDVATKKTKWFAPAPFESISTRTEDGPIYSPKGGEVVFVMDDLLYTMAVDGAGYPTKAAVQLNSEITDAPTWSADGSKILYLSGGKLRLMDRGTKAVTPVNMSLSWQREKHESLTLIHAGKVWSGQGAAVDSDMDVLVTGNRITSVAKHGSQPVPPGAHVIEAPKATLLPGLWENHVHPNSDNGIYYGDRMGRLWLVYGITELRDMADQAYRAVEEKESWESGAAVGPRLFATGEAIDGERVYYPMMIPTTSEAQLHREFDRLKALDFDFMKLYVRLPYSWVVEGQNYAHTQMGVQTAGHYLLPAVALGNDGMSHLSATSRWGWAYSRTLTGRSYSDVRSLLADSGMWTTSTLFEQAIYAEDPELADDVRYNVAPPWEKLRLQKTRDAVRNTKPESDMSEREEATVRAVLDGKGMIIGGTDSPLDTPASSLIAELFVQVKYGMKPYQALETVTSTAAHAASVGSDLGLVKKGMIADLILVEGDPLANIKDIRNVQCVMTNGDLHSVSQIAAPFETLNTGTALCSKP